MSRQVPTNHITTVPSPSVPREWDRYRAPLTLPLALTSFVGRDQETRTVIALLGKPDVRLLTVSGTGGVGKTRLAMRVLEDIHDTYADGVAFIALASIRDPELVLPTVAHALHVPDAPGQPVTERLRAFLAHREVLLVLDNFEHLPGAAPLVTSLLLGSPQLTIMCTSRTPLGVSGEHVLTVNALTSDAARQLFEERARAVAASFALTPATVTVVDEICARLDGLPLAIELAAARVSVMPPRAILDRLGHRLALLTNGPQDAPSRLRSMRDAIAWSHELLEADDRRLFRRLAVFIGGFSLDAAAAVAGTDQVLDQITRLASSHLIDVTTGIADEPRFTMLETIREYALEHLAASREEAPIRQAHADYYRRLTEAQLPLFDGPELRTAIDRIELELGNCRAALTWSLESGAAETGVRLAGALWRVWWYGHAAGTQPWTERVNEGRAWLSRVLANREGLPVAALVQALTGAGILARLQGDLGPAQVYGNELLSRSRAEGDVTAQYWASYMLGCVAEARQQIDDAREWYAQGLVAALALEDPGSHAGTVLTQLGRIALREDDTEAASAYLADALAHFRTSGHLAGTATAALYLAEGMRRGGDLAQPVPLLQESLTLFMDQRDFGGVHAALAELARVAIEAGHPVHAARLLAAAGTFPGHPDDAPAYDRAVSAARALVPASTFSTAWETGRQLSWDETLAEGRRLAAAILQPGAPARANRLHGLTRREVEILRLLANGHSNREIAEALSLSQRTAENHVLHILNKLGVDSRTAAATYAVRQGLA